ncbi:MAG TPA: bifunctional phosphoglucose/phosphomannose isomerase [Acidobacteriota bacterium]|jgi:glucose/mannose-6-phosphate isomerase|nr:bifunctional phosphoglucose/phosphomannose isomerase [Acidobacteriota bacterium]
MNRPETISEKLDNVASLRLMDPGGMLQSLESFPSQIREANELGSKFEANFSENVRNVVITGLGGSAIGGEVVQSVACAGCSVGIYVNREYRVPAFVGEETLVVACSYSGNTEETLSAYCAALERKARLIAITSGGELAERARKDGVAVVKIPSGRQPRTAIAYSVFPLLWILRRFGLCMWHGDLVQEVLAVTAAACGRYRPEMEGGLNSAKQIASSLHARIPVIYAPSDPLGAVATRWKGQFSENAKSLAMQNVLPEMTHNEIVGWKHPEWIRQTQVVCLRDRDEHPHVAARFEFLTQRLSSITSVLQFRGDGESLLARIFSLILLGDYASVYLAFLYSEDPTPVEVIEQLKQSLRGVP